ncbi:hypothetical protein [Oryzomonas rubra]|uniref:Uncharacterized protein n=1 Tax=Oryzomonas rubra TaxID=2509454 RepID=A0A5A9X6G4_9BACT|nr:hypothetical protein [Oryzomonas rubra]KAA0888762.1 hypothetical protein ET418_15390 [Oryzomonas rubra]
MMQTAPNIDAAIIKAAQYVQATWQQAAMGAIQLPGATTPTVNIGLRQLYADNIVLGNQVRGVNSVSQRIIATKKIAEQLENGCGPWDMKPMLLNGPKARVGKNGRYNIIPFRHGTGSSSAPNNNFKTMPKDIYQKARQMKATVQQGNRLKYGGRLTGTETKYAPGKNPTSGYQHKAGRFEGMVRVEKTYAKAKQSTYLTFRVVSEKSDPGSWIHPGYQAHHIAKGVENFCRSAVEQMIQEAATHDLQEAIVTIGAV